MLGRAARALAIDFKEKTGSYQGTVIDGKWWKRYRKNGYFARGNGRFWHDDAAFFFHKYSAKDPLAIAFRDVVGFDIGTWHAGQWCAGRPVLKIIWSRDGAALSSGFVLTPSRDELAGFVAKLEKRVP